MKEKFIDIIILDVLKIFYFKSNSLVLCEGNFVWFELLVLNNIMYERKWFYDGNLIISLFIRFVIIIFFIKNGILKNILYIVNVL